ncbi:MAG: xanthine dehydrogenase family protein subunit M [Rhodospirillales bacterium]|jgi:carbon-monoxide dehydrogenase medium subunit
MKPAPYKYHDPETVDDLVGLLGDLEDAKILAGGQSLMPMLNMRFLLPEHLIDINKIAELRFTNNDNGTLHIGAMTRQRDLLSSEEVRQHCPIMSEALRLVGHFQTRNRGTMGGSLCHLDPAAELPAIACLYNASLNIKGPDGERRIGFAEWPLAYMMPNIAPEEVLTSIEIPYWREPHGYALVEFARRHGDFAIVAVACLLALDGSGLIAKAALSVAGATKTPIRLSDVEKALIGEKADNAAFSAAAASARKLDTMSDAYYPAAYRQRLVGVLVERALAQAAERARGA